MDKDLEAPFDETFDEEAVITEERESPTPTSKNSYFRSLAILHLVVWGGFSLILTSTFNSIVKREILVEIIRLDQLSAGVETRQEWEVLQNAISSYVWSGAMFAGGWPVAMLYFSFIVVVFTALWTVVQMASIRIVTLTRPIGPLEAIIVTTPRLLSGLIPLYAGIAIVAGVVGLLLAPKISNPDAYAGSWRILDVLGSLPVAFIVAFVLCVAWILLFPQAVLGDSPKTAWLTSPRLVMRAPGLVIGRWLLYWVLALVAGGALIWVGLWLLAFLPSNFYAFGFITAMVFVGFMGAATWVTIQMLRIWERLTGPEIIVDSTEDVFFDTAPPVISFSSESAAWEEGENEGEGAEIYIPTLDGGVKRLEDVTVTEPEAVQDVNVLTPMQGQTLTAPSPAALIIGPDVSADSDSADSDSVETAAEDSSAQDDWDEATVSDMSDSKAKSGAVSVTETPDVPPSSAIEPEVVAAMPTRMEPATSHRKAPPKLSARKKRGGANSEKPKADSVENLSNATAENEAAGTTAAEDAPVEQIAVTIPDIKRTEGVTSEEAEAASDVEITGAEEETNSKREEVAEAHVADTPVVETALPTPSSESAQPSTALHRKKPPKLPKKK